MNLKNRLYLDHNATTPVSGSVYEHIKEMPFANPSSVHGSGKKARREVGIVTDFLHDLFQMESNTFEVVYHSGATEGINTIAKGLALEAKKAGESFTFFYLGSDHSCINNQKGFLHALGFDYKELPIDENGALLEEQAIKLIKENPSSTKFLNFTWVNNETGIVFDLAQAERIKEATGVIVHVDAVQAVGKISNWFNLSSNLDFYTFSGHKFGALKGCGFSFVRAELPLMPLLNGGGQQLGRRSGTENTFGILSLKLALEEVKEGYDHAGQRAARDWFEDQIQGLLADQGEVIGKKAKRNGNTIYFFLYEVSAQNAAMVFDMAGIDLSNGSACSSGAVVPSRVLLAMGYNESQAKSALRVSFAWNFNHEDAQNIWDQFEGPLKRLLSNN